MAKAKTDYDISHSELLDYITYNPEDGTWFSKKINRKVGSRHSVNGYIYVRINGHSYRSCRLAIFYMTGQWPPQVVDHINCVRDDDRWANLRQATWSQNNQNKSCCRGKVGRLKGAYHRPFQRTSGHVYPRLKPWQAMIFVGGRSKSLGYYLTPEEANRAYSRAAVEYFGEFARSA